MKVRRTSKNNRKENRHKLFVRFKRRAKYLYLKLIRLNDSPEKIALGVAIGAAAGLLPTFGLGLILALLVAYIIGANKRAAILGSFIMNPLTIPLVWTLSSVIGATIFWEDTDKIVSIIKNYNVASGLKWAFVVYLVGNLVLTTVSSLIIYILVKKLVIKNRRRSIYRKMRQRKDANT